MPLIIRRALAFFIDCALVLCYAVALFFVVTRFSGSQSLNLGPIAGQVIAFVSLTLPVYLASVFLESTRRRATLGKRIMRIKVNDLVIKRTDTRQVALRNAIKFLPWEVAHGFVQWLFYYDRIGVDTPFWLFIGAVIPQLVVLWYFFSAVVHPKGQTPYDRLAKTRVVEHRSPM